MMREVLNNLGACRTLAAVIVILVLRIFAHAQTDENAEAGQARTPAWTVALTQDLKQMAEELNRTVKPWKVPDCVFRVTDFGAVGDGVTVNTRAIQKAIDTCSDAGGGVVLVADGRFVTGTINLLSRVMLEIADDAVLLGSVDIKDYPDRVAKRRTVMDSHMSMNQSLIFAEGVEQIGIRGRGLIDLRGTHENFPGKQTVGPTPGRPFGIRVLDCKQVVIQNITLRDAACWMQNYLNCENVLIDGVTVDNHANWNNDGLDIDGCRNVIVRNTYINAEDDALCFKGASLRPTENVLVENSAFYSTCNALKFGTDSQGDFRRVLIRDVKLGGPPKDLRAIRRRPASSGISFMSVDGGIVENILVERVTIDRTHSPLFLCAGDRGRVVPGMPRPAPGYVRRIVFKDIVGSDNASRGSFFTGIEERPIQDISLSDVRLGVAGGIRQTRDVDDVPKSRSRYPDAQSFGKFMPAYGLWLRHAERITMDNVSFENALPDARPAVLGGPGTVSPPTLPAHNQPIGEQQ